MTVQFKPKVNILDDTVPENYTHAPSLSEYPKNFGNSLNKKPSFPAESWWITQVYITQSETLPIKWEPYDNSTYSNAPNLEEGFQEWVSYVSKADASGWKIITLALDMHSGQAAFEPSYCKEHFKPKEKIYINGPKKKPFPKAASKHY